MPLFMFLNTGRRGWIRRGEALKAFSTLATFETENLKPLTEVSPSSYSPAGKARKRAE